jgi:tetratricopeptide (TPR) repeat protein
MMRRSEQISTLWDVARESSPEGERLRRRIGALAALSVLVCGFLLSIGLGLLVLAFLVGVLISVGVVALAGVWPQLRRRAAEWITGLRSRGGRARAVLVPLARKAHGSGASALASARAHSATLARGAVESGSRAGRDLAQSARSTAIRFAPRPARTEPLREALRLNAAGAQHRRDGRYDEAVECHRQALEILRTLGDRRAVALTQSNLALALSHAGDDEWAIGLFEEAAATLGELGDEEHEAQIMANLGLAHRRHGRPEEGDNVLELALNKLSPESSAYHAIETQLSRAS